MAGSVPVMTDSTSSAPPCTAMSDISPTSTSTDVAVRSFTLTGVRPSLPWPVSTTHARAATTTGNSANVSQTQMS